MCNNNFMLVIFLILKIIVLIITPIALYFLYKKERKEYILVGGLDIIFILIFIILRLTGNPCVVNSSIFKISKSRNDKVVSERANTIYESIYSTKQYSTKDMKTVYYYSINSTLKNVKISCDKKSYIKNYGDSITAITTLIANAYEIDINEISIINYLENNKIIDCENGVDFDKAIKALSKKYSYKVIEISKSKVDNYVSNGNSVLVVTKNNNDLDDNFGCEKDYIIIYNKNNDGNYNIINPNDKSYSYFCPSNTIGYGSIIESNQNDKVYSLDSIDNKAVKYIVIEVN